MLNNNPNSIKVGDLILRDVEFYWMEPSRMAELYPVPSDSGGVIFRAITGKTGSPYFLADKNSWVVTSGKRGLVCFCYFRLPEDTSNVIGFIVTRINKNGTSVCVRPAFGTLEKLLEHYDAPSGCVLHARQV